MRLETILTAMTNNAPGAFELAQANLDNPAVTDAKKARIRAHWTALWEAHTGTTVPTEAPVVTTASDTEEVTHEKVIRGIRRLARANAEARWAELATKKGMSFVQFKVSANQAPTRERILDEELAKLVDGWNALVDA